MPRGERVRAPSPETLVLHEAGGPHTAVSHASGAVGHPPTAGSTALRWTGVGPTAVVIFALGRWAVLWGPFEYSPEALRGGGVCVRRGRPRAVLSLDKGLGRGGGGQWAVMVEQVCRWARVVPSDQPPPLPSSGACHRQRPITRRLDPSGPSPRSARRRRSRVSGRYSGGNDWNRFGWEGPRRHDGGPGRSGHPWAHAPPTHTPPPPPPPTPSFFVLLRMCRGSVPSEDLKRTEGKGGHGRSTCGQGPSESPHTSKVWGSMRAWGMQRGGGGGACRRSRKRCAAPTTDARKCRRMEVPGTHRTRGWTTRSG